VEGIYFQDLRSGDPVGSRILPRWERAEAGEAVAEIHALDRAGMMGVLPLSEGKLPETGSPAAAPRGDTGSGAKAVSI